MFPELTQAVVLGLVQGLGEFLPISSTAHLILVPYFFHWTDPGLSFDVALHLGTLIAVGAFFWRDWWLILRLALGNNQAQGQAENPSGFNQKTLFILVLATLPGIFAGYFLEDFSETVFRHPLVIAGNLVFFGGLLYLTDRFSRRDKEIKQLGWKEALFIGLFQAVAVVPGISRSGASMTAALFLGQSRTNAARFSFLLSTPIIFGAAGLKIPELMEKGIGWEIIFAVALSAFSGYVAIKYLLRFIEKVGYGVFFWYRLLLAILIGGFFFYF